jgi:lipopolysaccharide/colanic/teichoic acid biosynthesis glycosyltransferase
MLKRLLDAAAKRGMDLALAGAGVAVSWPVMVLIAAAIAIEDKDSPFYIQERVGKNGRTFRLLKFRTMAQRPADEAGPEITIGEDPRITKVGEFLRGARLDELPQLFNILLGDMSVVGPRPEVPRYVAYYDEEQLAVLMVRPGLTDPATLAYRHEAERLSQSDDPEGLYIEQIMPEKLAMNLTYLAERNTLKDMQVFLRTVVTVLGDQAGKDST